MRTDSQKPDAPFDSVDRAWLATRPADPNVAWDSFWTDVVAESERENAATDRPAPGLRWNGRRKLFAGLTLSFASLAAAAVLVVAFSPAGAPVDRPIDVAAVAPAPQQSVPKAPVLNAQDGSVQEVSVDSGQVFVLRLDKNGRLRTEGTGWEPSLVIGDSAYGYGTSDDSFEFIGYLEALGLDSLAVSDGTSQAAPSRTP